MFVCMCVVLVVKQFEFVGWSRGYIDKNPTNGLDVAYAKFKKGNKSDSVCCIE